ncbi:hypothetical protein [Peribacillus alkalitolerans]|uniref:hypothetical protein n=1 Tax=Peribacillus alkalitolerans TaxID=1550385 RepID=UPI0013D2AB07|nr:hypothetical protein [Peribacillus alkalitolerans]
MKNIIIAIECLLIVMLIYRISRIIIAYRKIKVGSFPNKISEALSSSIRSKIGVAVLRHELVMYYYLFTKTGEIKLSPDETSFSYYKSSGYKTFMIAILAITLLETVGVSYLLHNWKPVIAWIHLFLNFYLFVFFISDYKGYLRNPFILGKDTLLVQLGWRSKMVIPLCDLERLLDGKDYEEEKKKKDVYMATLMEMETPQYCLELKNPVTVTEPFGRKREVTKVYITVDDPQLFSKRMREAINQIEKESSSG